MKIKITPETDMEKQRMKEVVHKGVNDFFMMGNKMNGDEIEDFSDWRANYRFLIGNLYYFLNQIKIEETMKKNEPISNAMNITDEFTPELEVVKNEPEN